MSADDAAANRKVNSSTAKQKTPTSAASVITKQINPRPNPLGNFSSYTYGLSLYMATPSAMSNFVNTGKFNKRDNFFLIAQSGGISSDEKRALTLSDTIGTNQRGLDYYIDDVSLKFNLTGSNGAPTVETGLEFKIVEPVGFNFFAFLQNASSKINQITRKDSGLTNDESADPPPMSQFYVFGIKFYGYDKDGEIVTTKGTQSMYAPGVNEVSSDNKYALYEKYFAIMITAITYQLNGKVVTYNVSAIPVCTIISEGTKFGTMKSDATIVANTVEEALRGLSETASNANRSLKHILNTQQATEEKNKNRQELIEYDIVFGPNTEAIKKAKVGIPSEPSQAPPSTAANSSQSNPKTAAANASSQTTKRSIPIRPGIPITKVIDGIISNSSYVTDKQTATTTAAVATTSNPNSPGEFYWHTIRTVVTPNKRDNITKDWSYKITYTIERITVQYAKSLYIKTLPEYRQPTKKYKYFLTGENTEVLSFTQNYESQFYLLQATSINPIQINPNNKVSNQYTGGVLVGATTGSLPNRGSEINQHVQRVMNYSYADQALATIEIMGDPEFIMSNVGGLQDVLTVDQDFELNPYTDFIWIEIDFNSADDYKSDGTLNISKTVFYPYINSEKVSDKHGLIYRVLGVECRFVSGRFTQVLDLVLVSDDELNIPEVKEIVAERKAQAASPPVVESNRSNRSLQENMDLLRKTDLALRSRQVPLPVGAQVPKGKGPLADDILKLDPKTLLPSSEGDQRSSQPALPEPGRSGRANQPQSQTAGAQIPRSARLTRRPQD